MPLSGGDLGVGIAIVGKDRFSGPSKSAGKSFDTLSGKVGKGTKKMSNQFSNLGTTIGGVFSTALLVAPLFGFVSASATVSDALADVTKTTGIAGEALEDLRSELEALDTRTSVLGLLEIAKAGGQMGVAAPDLAKFTDSIDKLNVALGDQFESPEVLARGIAQLTGNLNDIKSGNFDQDLLRVGNVLNFMGANAKATEANIFDITQRLVGLQTTAKLSSGEIFGISTAMAETGLSAELLG